MEFGYDVMYLADDVELETPSLTKDSKDNLQKIKEIADAIQRDQLYHQGFNSNYEVEELQSFLNQLVNSHLSDFKKSLDELKAHFATLGSHDVKERQKLLNEFKLHLQRIIFKYLAFENEIERCPQLLDNSKMFLTTLRKFMEFVNPFTTEPGKGNPPIEQLEEELDAGIHVSEEVIKELAHYKFKTPATCTPETVQAAPHRK